MCAGRARAIASAALKELITRTDGAVAREIRFRVVYFVKFLFENYSRYYLDYGRDSVVYNVTL